MEKHSTTHRLNDHEIDVVLAALRLLQQTPEERIPEGILDIAGESINEVDISELCERLNLGSVDDGHGDNTMLLRRIRAEMSRPDWSSDLMCRLETALEQGGWPIFVTDHEGWHIDELDGKYTVSSSYDGLYDSNEEAVAAIGERFAAGSRWHGEVLDVIGMAACGAVSNLPDLEKRQLQVKGLGSGNHDLRLVTQPDNGEFLSIGYRPDPHSFLFPNEEKKEVAHTPGCDAGFWVVYQTQSHPYEDRAVNLKSYGSLIEALHYCASELRGECLDGVADDIRSHYQ